MAYIGEECTSFDNGIYSPELILGPLLCGMEFGVWLFAVTLHVSSGVKRVAAFVRALKFRLGRRAAKE